MGFGGKWSCLLHSGFRYACFERFFFLVLSMCSVGVFFPGVDTSYKQKVEVPEVRGRLLMFFFLGALLFILPSCMWLSMSYVWWFIAGFVCFTCRVLNGSDVQGSEVRFKDSFRCLWESGLLKDAVVCSLCMPSLRCRWLCTFSVLTVWDSACVWSLYLLVLPIVWASRVAGSPSLLSSFTNRPQRKLVSHLRACLLVV